jgi:hypothetical protein
VFGEEGMHQRGDPPVVSLDFNVGKLYYTLSVQVPEVTAKVKMSGYNRSTAAASLSTHRSPIRRRSIRTSRRSTRSK